MCSVQLKAPHHQMVEPPELTPEELDELHQKTVKPIIIFLQVLVLNLCANEGGFDKALVALKSCQDENREFTQETIEYLIAQLRKGNKTSWYRMCKLAYGRPKEPVSKIVLRLTHFYVRKAA